MYKLITSRRCDVDVHLSARQVVVRVEQTIVVAKHLGVVRLKEHRTQGLVYREDLLEGREGVGRDVERRHLDVIEQVVELVAVEHDLGERLVPGALAQHQTAVQRDLRLVVAVEQQREDVRPRRHVIHRRQRPANVPPQKVVEDLRDHLLRLELDERQRAHESQQQVARVNVAR